MSSIYLDVYEHAKLGHLEQVQKITLANPTDPFLIQMIFMGAVENKEAAIAQWALEKGACLVFGLKHSSQHSLISYNYPKNVSMLHGPGEVPKGTFKQH